MSVNTSIRLDSADKFKSISDRNSMQKDNIYFSKKNNTHDSSFQYPIRMGDEYDVSIQDMSRDGDSGVARIRGLITFVRGTKPDDRVRIKITKIGRGYAIGQLIAYLDS